jgi:hypothetical protein
MSTSRIQTIRGFLPLFVIVFVIAGVVAVVVSRPASSPAELLDQGTENELTATSTLVFGTEAGVVLVQGDKQKICPWPEEIAHIRSVDAQGIVISLSPANRLMNFDCSLNDRELAMGPLNPSNTKGAIEGEWKWKEEGAHTVYFYDGIHEDPVTPRDSNGRLYQYSQIVGWMNDTQVAMTAVQGDQRHALIVEPTGRVTPLVKLPETALAFTVSENTFWYVTATEPQDIAFGPQGPSELHRVTSDGTDTMIARSEDAVIDEVLAGTDGRAAYVVSGSLYVINGDTAVNRGTGRPMGWQENGALMVEDNDALLVIPNGKGARTTLMEKFPESVDRVWAVSLEASPSAR